MKIEDIFDKELALERAKKAASQAEQNRREKRGRTRIAELRRELETLRDSRLPGLKWDESNGLCLTIELFYFHEIKVFHGWTTDELVVEEERYTFDDLGEKRRTLSSSSKRVATVAEAAQLITALIAEDVAQYPNHNSFTRRPDRNFPGCSVIFALMLLGFVGLYVRSVY